MEKMWARPETQHDQHGILSSCFSCPGISKKPVVVCVEARLQDKYYNPRLPFAVASMTTVNSEIQDTKMQRPHVVILGAGASLAAFPNGDANGQKLPIINNLIEILGITDLLEKYSIDSRGKDFEELYSDLVSEGKQNEAIKEIDCRVQEYFVSLSLPEPPTLYDHLILSLRPKDYIATFNWDPFLFRSCARLYGRVPLPKILFLHGNVAVGYCETDRMKGAIGSSCGKCGKFYAECRLLFPIKQKDYNSDPLFGKSGIP